MAESITCQRGLITAGGDKEPGGGGQAAHSGMRGTGSSFGLFFFFFNSPLRCSLLSPNADGGCATVAGGVPPAEPPAAAAGMEDARPRTRGFCCRRCGGRVPVAAPRTRANPGGTTGKAGEPISHPACCASASPCSLLASPPAKRLSALPSPCNRRQTRATLISAISPLLFP